MSVFDYEKALELSSSRFNALTMGAMLTGRPHEVERLRRAFPHIAAELDERQRSPDGRTRAERDFDNLEMPIISGKTTGGQT